MVFFIQKKIHSFSKLPLKNINLGCSFDFIEVLDISWLLVLEKSLPRAAFTVSKAQKLLRE